MPASTGQGSLWQKLARWLDAVFLLALVLTSILLDFSRLPFSTLKLLRLLLLLYLGTIFALTRLPLIFLTSLKELLRASHGRNRIWRLRRSVFLKTPFFALTALFIFYTFQPHGLRRSRGQEATPSASLGKEATPSAIPTTKDSFIQEKIAKKQATLLKSDFKASEEIEAFVGSHSLGSLKTTVLDPNGQEISPPTTIEGEILKIKPELNFRPGKYIVKITNENNQTVLEQNFTWGVLAINTNKSIYLPGEKVYLQMAVLSDYGHTICDASLELKVTNPKSETQTLTTAEGTIKNSETCGANNVTDNPDYFAYYQVAEIGIYNLKLINLDNKYEVEDSFEVRESVPFEIERVGATRINPFQANYWMTLKIKANEDFEGEVKETLPAGFEVTQSGGGQVGTPGDVLPIVWPVNLKKGDVRELKYEYDAPDVSPQLYLLGPLTIQPFDNSAIVFQESRQWQIAADAACTATGDGTWGGTDTANFLSCTGAASGGTGTGNRPGSGDTLTINEGINITLSVDATIAGLTICDSTCATNTDLTHADNSIDLTVSTTVYIWGGTGSADHGIWYINAGTGTVSGLITFDPQATNAGRDARITMTTGTLNANGGITFDSTTGMIDNQLLIANTGTINFKGAFTNLSNADLRYTTAGTFNYADTAAAQTIRFDGSAPTYFDLTINNTHSSGATLEAEISGSSNMVGSLTVGDGSNAALFKNGGFAIALASSKIFEVKNGAAFEMSGTSAFPSGTGITYTFGATSTVRHLQTTSPLTITDADYGHLELKPAGAATYNFPAATVWVQGNLTVGDGTNTATVSANNASTTLDVDGDFTIAAASAFTAHASNPFTVGGSWSNSATGTFTHSSGTVTFNAGATGKQIDSGGDNFNNVIFNNADGGWTAVTNTLNILGTLTITAGNFDTGAVTNAITGATDVTGTLTISSTGGDKTFTGNVTINAGGTWSETAAEDIVFNGNFTCNAMSLITDTGIHYFGGTSKTISGSTLALSMSNVSISESRTNSTILYIGTSLTGAGSFTNGDGSTGTLNFGGTSIGVTTFTASAVSNTVNYNSSSAGQTIRGVTYHDLTITKSGQVGTLGGAIVVDGDLTISAGELNTSAASSYAVTLNGGFSNSGTFSANASDIVIGGTSATPSIAGFTTTGDLSFTRTASTATFTGDVVAASLTMNGSGGTLNLGVSKSHTINGAVTLTAGTLNGGSSTLALTGDWTGDATFTGATGTVNFSSGGSQTITCAASTFNNLTITSSTSTTSTFTVGSDLTVNGTLAVSSGSGTITVNGDVTGSGTMNMTAGTLDQRVATNSVFGSSSGSNDWTFNNLTFSATPGAVNISNASNNGTGREVVRTSSGTLYTFLSNAGSCEIWKSTGGSSWYQQDPDNNPSCNSTYKATAIAIDGDGILHMVYITSTFYIKYRTFSTTTDLFTGTEESVTDGAPWSLSISIDSYNVPHIVYDEVGEAMIGYIFYINRYDGSWGPEIIEVTSTMRCAQGASGDITLNSGDYPVVSVVCSEYYSMNPTLDAYIGDQNDPTDFTQKVDIDTSINLTSSTPSLGVDSSNNTWIAFIDETTNYVSLAKHTGSDWSTSWSTITNSNAGSKPSIAVNGSDIYVFYENDTDDIAYDVYNGSDWAEEVVLQLGTYQDVNARWSYSNNPSYSTYGFDYLFSDGEDVYWDKIGGGSSSLTVTLNSGGSGSLEIGGTLQVGKDTDEVDTNLDDETYDRIIDVNGDLTITSKGVFSASSTQNLTIAGDFTNSGDFTANSGEVIFDGADVSTQIITGSTSFYDFTASTLTNGDDRTLQFAGGSVTIVTGTWTITGYSGKVITLQSSDTSNWTVTPTAAAVTYVDVYRSTRTGTTFCATFSTKDVNCIDWTVSDGGSCGGNTAPNVPTALAQKKTTDAVLAVDEWTNETSVKFTATADDTDNPDTLYLCVEKKPIASAFTGPEDGCSSPGISYVGTPVEVTVTIAGVTDTEYHWRARVKDAADDYSSWVAYGGNPAGDGTTDGSPANRDYGIDTSDPTLGDIYDGTEVGVDTDFSTTSLSALSANWANFDATVSGLASYDYSIGTTQGGIGVKGWTNVGVGSSAAATGLTLQTSQVYYFNVRAVDNAGNTQDPVISSDGQVITPSLSFSVSPSTLNFANLNSINSYTTTADATLTTSTNAYNGYVVRAFITDYPHSLVGDFTIPDFTGGDYASPDEWLSGDRGFGYHSSDTSVGVGGSNIFNSTPCPGGGDPPCYAPFNHDPPGDIIADHTANVSGEPITGEPFTITCKVMADNTKEAANYVTTIVYTITAQY